MCWVDELLLVKPGVSTDGNNGVYEASVLPHPSFHPSGLEEAPADQLKCLALPWNYKIQPF